MYFTNYVSRAIRLATETGMFLPMFQIVSIIKCRLFACLDVLQSKPNLAVDVLSFAIRLAGMID